MLTFFSSNRMEITFANICYKTAAIEESVNGSTPSNPDRTALKLSSARINLISKSDSVILVSPMPQSAPPSLLKSYFLSLRDNQPTHRGNGSNATPEPLVIKNCLIVASVNDVLKSGAGASREVKPLFELAIKDCFAPSYPTQFFVFRDAGSSFSSSSDNNFRLFELDGALNRLAAA